jgi:hypothetical protein
LINTAAATEIMRERIFLIKVLLLIREILIVHKRRALEKRALGTDIRIGYLLRSINLL